MVIPSGVLSLLIVGFALAIAVRVIAGDAPDASFTNMILRIASIVFFILGSLGLLIGMGLLFGFTLWVAGLVIVAMVFARRRLLRRRMLLSLLALTAEKQMPLAEILRAFTLEQRGFWRLRLERLTEQLENGVPLATALADSPGLVPREAHLAAKVGEQSGALGPALRDSVAAMQRLHPLAHATITRITYALFAVMFAGGIASFIMYSIAPQFMKIFNDFDTKLPRMTQLVWDIFGNPQAYIVFQVLWIVLFGIACWSILIYVGWIPARLGPLERLLVRLDRSVILRSLGLLLARDQDLPRALEVIGKWYPKAWIRNRLQRAQHSIATGRQWVESLLGAGLLSHTDAAVLSAAARVGNVPWAMRELAETNERRLIYAIEALLYAAFPVIVLIFGAFVAVFVVAWFIPLVSIIQNLT